MKALVTVVLVILGATAAQAQDRLPIIDMHLHACSTVAMGNGKL